MVPINLQSSVYSLHLFLTWSGKSFMKMVKSNIYRNYNDLYVRAHDSKNHHLALADNFENMEFYAFTVILIKIILLIIIFQNNVNLITFKCVKFYILGTTVKSFPYPQG